MTAAVSPASTAAEIRAYAAANGIDLAGARTKSRMLEAIKEAERGDSKAQAG